MVWYFYRCFYLFVFHVYLISDNTPPVLSWRKKVKDVTGKRVRFRWQSNEVANFHCAHEEIEDEQKCGNLRWRGNWLEADLPEGKHRFWVTGVDEVGNRGKPLYHEWIVGKIGMVSECSWMKIHCFFMA